MSVVNTVTSAIGNISNFWNYNKEDFLLNLGNDEILQIGNTLSSLFNGDDAKNFKINIPNLTVVGAQSSGKSTLLNRIIGMNILPTGSNMVTRAPLHLQLKRSSITRAEFGYYHNGNWICEKIINISSNNDIPTPTINEIDDIRNEIKNQTIKKAGDLKNISYNEIILKIFSPKIPDISLIDLPGLTTISLTDKGQPANIPEQIRNLVGNYINNPRTIILVVMPARCDLETDIALDLVKKYDKNGDRSCGILTKVDLMNSDNDISDYLNNNMSNSLHLKYGYYAIKNRHNNTNNMIEISNGEKLYFNNHKIYNKLDCQNRLGIHNLRNNLSNILIKHLKDNIPDILREINKKYDNINQLLDDMGPGLPDSNEAKFNLLNQLLSEHSRKFINALEEKCGLNFGLKIKNKFINYRKNIDKLFPTFSHDIIEKTIQNSSGNHMDFSVFSIEILEKTLNNIDPFKLLIKPSYQLVKDISSLLNDLNDIILDNPKMLRFPKLINIIKNTIIKINNDNQNNIYNYIDNLINIEKNYIWTDNEHFLKELKILFKKSFENNNISIIEKLLSEYFNTVKSTFKDQIPKYIMYFMVSNIQNIIHSKLFELLTNDKNINLLLEEPTNIHKKRKDLENKKLKLYKAKSSLLNALINN